MAIVTQAASITITWIHQLLLVQGAPGRMGYKPKHVRMPD
jgi:hypothetical protein